MRPGAGALAAFRGLLRKEAYHILRDRRTLFVVLAMPVVQVVLFGYALQTDVEEVRLVVVDPAPDARTRELAARFAAPAEYEVVATLPAVEELPAFFQRGAADQALVFRPGFARDLRSPEGASVLVITDAASPLTGSSMEAYARGVLTAYRRDLARRAAGGSRAVSPTPSSNRFEEGGAEDTTAPAASRSAAGGSGADVGPAPLAVGSGGAAPALVRAGPAIEARTRFRFNPTLESQYLFVPGLLAFVLTIISALMTAITVSREKETGTMEVLLVSPLRPSQIVLGKVVPYLGLAFLNALTTLGVAWAVFRVPVRGSLSLLFAESLLFVAVCLALGVLISTRTPSQRTAMLGVILGTLLPTAILSGMIFPIESMPGWLRPVTAVVPATWFIAIVRGIMLKGAALDVLWDETLILLVMTVALLAVSVRSLKPRLE